MIYLFLTLSTKDLAGLKEGIKCSGIITAPFFLIFLPIFLALFFACTNPLSSSFATGTEQKQKGQILEESFKFDRRHEKEFDGH